MPNYRIEFIGGGHLNREPLNVVCVDDDQALRWAAGFLEHHLGAEVTHGKRTVGWITTSDNEQAATLIKVEGVSVARCTVARVMRQMGSQLKDQPIVQHQTMP